MQMHQRNAAMFCFGQKRDLYSHRINDIISQMCAVN